MTKYETGIQAVAAARELVSGRPAADALKGQLGGLTKVEDRFAQLRTAIVEVVHEARLNGLLASLKVPDALTPKLAVSTKNRRLHTLCDCAQTALALIQASRRGGPQPSRLTPETRRAIWDLQGALRSGERKSHDQLDQMTEEEGQAWLEQCRQRREERERERRGQREEEINRLVTERLQAQLAPFTAELTTLRQERDQLRQEKEAAVASLAEKDRLFAELTQLRDDAVREVGELTQTQATLEQQLAQATVDKTAAETARTQAEGAMADKDNEIADLKAKLTAAEGSLTVANEQLKLALAAIKEDKPENLVSRLTELMQRRADGEQAVRELAALDQQLAALPAEHRPNRETLVTQWRNLHVGVEGPGGTHDRLRAAEAALTTAKIRKDRWRTTTFSLAATIVVLIVVGVVGWLVGGPGSLPSPQPATEEVKFNFNL